MLRAVDITSRCARYVPGCMLAHLKNDEVMILLCLVEEGIQIHPMRECTRKADDMCLWFVDRLFERLGVLVVLMFVGQITPEGEGLCVYLVMMSTFPCECVICWSSVGVQMLKAKALETAVAMSSQSKHNVYCIGL